METGTTSTYSNPPAVAFETMKKPQTKKRQKRYRFPRLFGEPVVLEDLPPLPIDNPESAKIEYQPTFQPYIGNKHILASPLVEVFSVTFQGGVGDRKPHQIYGSIEVVCGNGVTFNIYEREKDDPETLPSTGGALSLTTYMAGSFIVPFPETRMNVRLMDKTRGRIVCGSLYWDYTTKCLFDEVTTDYVRGKRGFVAVCYTTYRAALGATVDIRFDKANVACKVHDNSARIFGTIVARCVKNYETTHIGEEENNCSVILFKQPIEQKPVDVDFETSLIMDRYFVAVPAHSRLVIEADLQVGGISCKYLDGKCEFKPHFYSETTEYIKGDCLNAKVQVTWRHPYMFERKEAQSVEKHLTALNLDGNQPLTGERSTSATLGDLPLEVFSVFVGGDEDITQVYGTVCNSDGSCLFDEDEHSSVWLPPSRTLPLVGPRGTMTGTILGVELDLKDGRGRDISQGMLLWQGTCYGGPITWYDRRICSVILGKHGYALVHYAIFSSGVRARVELACVTKSNPIGKISDWREIQVMGSVVASYGGHSYLTYYEDEYYKSKLFDEKTPVGISSDGIIPLSRSVLSVPEGTHLVIELDLFVFCPMMRRPECLRTREEFTMGTRLKVFQGEFFDIALNVKWSALDP